MLNSWLTNKSNDRSTSLLGNLGTFRCMKLTVNALVFQENKENAEIERRQRETKRIVKEYCRANHRNLSLPLTRFFVLDSPPLLYCLMPKVASRLWRKLLLRIDRRKQLSSNKLNATDVENYFSRSYKFMFVREPFERLLSAYKDKFVTRRPFDRPLLRHYGRKIIENFRPNANQQSLNTLDDITFAEFIEYIIKEGVYEGLNIHWNTYEEQCNPCLVDYDFIGRFEFLGEDGNYVFKQAGVKRIQFPDEKPFDTRVELLKYYSQIPLEWILELGRIYRSNFETFGYPFPGPLEPLFHNATHSSSPEDRKAV